MKKLLFISFLFFSFNSSSQDLLRVIDTVLVLDIQVQTDINQAAYGEMISPPSGKVWKIQSILLDPGYKPYVDHCNINVTGNIPPNEITSFIEIDDGISNLMICQEYVNGPTQGPSGSGANAKYRKTYNCFDKVMWVNSSSTLKIGVVSTNFQYSHTHCINYFTTKAHVSILEFDNL